MKSRTLFLFHFSHSRKMILPPRCSVRIFFFFFLFFYFNTKFLVILYHKYTCLLFHSSAGRKYYFHRYLLFDDWIGFRFIFTNPLFLSVFFSPQLFDNLSFTGIYRATVIRSLSKVARGYLATNTGWPSTTRQASSMASAVLTALRHFSKILRLPLTNILYLSFHIKCLLIENIPRFRNNVFSSYFHAFIKLKYVYVINCYFIFNSILILKIHPL